MITVEEAFKLVKNNITPNEKTILIEVKQFIRLCISLRCFLTNQYAALSTISYGWLCFKSS